MRASQPLRDEHRALLPEIGALRAAADAVGTTVADARLDSARRLLDQHLVPHMAAEEAVLYPRIDELAGTDVTVTMRRDHNEIRRRLVTLGELQGRAGAGAGVDSELRAALYGLDAIVRLHLAKGEELYYPLVDAQLGGSEAVEVVTAVHRVERSLYRERTARPDGEGQAGA